jgi:hypothetical protein
MMATILCLAATGCANILRNPAPMETASKAIIPGFTDIRYFPFSDPAPARAMLYDAFKTETPESYEVQKDGTRVYNYLSVSGGGSDGAFGAGLLNGWTETGDRPSFKVVTGVSTGALIAPFAFLGPKYDAALKASYTTVDARQIFIAHSMLSLIWSEAATDTAPFKALVAKFIDDKVLADIAIENAKGRRLFVASTNLDAEQPVMWDLGAIASSNSPNKLALFRTVLVASASIPAVFPPTMIDVTIDGKKYDEMHVDGGVFFQSFSIGTLIDLPKAIKDAHPDFKGEVIQRLYVLRNGRVTPEQKQVQRGLTSITGRAIGSMLKVSGINDLYRLYLSCLHDNVEFRFVAIPRDYKATTAEQFNQAEMIQEYGYGHDLALKGIPWLSLPPGYNPK